MPIALHFVFLTSLLELILKCQKISFTIKTLLIQLITHKTNKKFETIYKITKKMKEV